MWRDLYSEVSQPVPDLEKIRTLVNTASGSSSSTDHLAGTNPADGRTTYMEAARGGTDVHLDCLKIILKKHMDKCGFYYPTQLPIPLRKRDKSGWSLFMHAAHGGHLQTLEYVFELHQELKLSIDKAAIDPNYVSTEAAVQFVVDRVFNGRIESLIEHVPLRTVRSPDAGIGAVGNSVATTMYRRQLEEAAAVAASHAIAANRMAAGGAAQNEPSSSSSTTMVAQFNSQNQQEASGVVNPSIAFDNEGREGDTSANRNPTAADEDDRKLPAVAEGAVPNVAGSNNNNLQLSQGTQASNEISDDDAVYDYATDAEGAAEKLVAGSKRKSASMDDVPSRTTGSAGSADGSYRKKKRSPSSSQSMHQKRRPYKLPTARSASQPAFQPTSPARQDHHNQRSYEGRPDLELELEKQKEIAKTFEEQAEQTTAQLSALQQEKERQDKEIEDLRKALATKNKKLKNIKGNLGCVSHMLEGVLKESVPDTINRDLECIKGAIGCASRMLDDVE